LDSEFASRVSEGFPGAKIHPRGPQNHYVDQLEAMVISLARSLFRVKYVEWRPVSTSMANAAIFFSLLAPGSVVIAQTEDGGGNYSYQQSGTLGLAGARVFGAPHARTGAFEIDIDGVNRLAAEVRPKMIVVGGSNVVGEYPISDLRAIADRHGAILLFDAAHLGLFIAAQEYQHPLDAGAHLMTISTHKAMGGPVGGMVLTNNAELAKRVSNAVFPGLVQTRDQNKYAALAKSLADVTVRGHDWAAGMKANANELAHQLARRGLDMISIGRVFTATHQLFASIGDRADGFERACHLNGLLLASCMLEDDASLRRRTGLRLASHEITWRGMRPGEMASLADLITRANSVGGYDAGINGELKDLLASYPPR
jgi:glycine hydroxymethyltransferase